MMQALTFEAHKHERRFAPFVGRIEHVIVRDSPLGPGSNAWDREYHQRNALLRGLEAAGGYVGICISISRMCRYRYRRLSRVHGSSPPPFQTRLSPMPTREEMNSQYWANSIPPSYRPPISRSIFYTLPNTDH
jgi:hypothetical protein